MSALLMAAAVPLAFALLCFGVPSNRVRPCLLPAAALAQLTLVYHIISGASRFAASDGGWVGLDPLGTLLLAYLGILFTPCAFYAPAYLRVRREKPNRIFCTMLLIFFAMMNLFAIAQHVGLMWVSIEATTLSSAPLIYFNHNRRSIEATWKYLLINSVGIGIALLGTFFLGRSVLNAGLDGSLVLPDVIAHASELSRPWLRAAFVLLLVGYGTKMGLAPMHTWKPDAYREAPGLVGALLAGGLTSCAFVGVLRFYSITLAAGDSEYARDLMMAFGLFSMALAALFMLRQRDYKRLLAYSSVEQMGILMIGASIGGVGLFGALLHMLNNCLTKAALFLSASNIRMRYQSSDTDEVRGALVVIPISGSLFLLGFFALTGAPPFGPFLSEFSILRAALEQDQFLVAASFVMLLLVVFIGMGGTVLAVVQGQPVRGHDPERVRERVMLVAPIAALLAVVLLLGIWIPAPLEGALWAATEFIEGPR